MILDELVLHNFGVYVGRQTLQLTPEPGKPIILLGGMNGGGKTTLLDGLQLVLFGSRASISSRRGASYDSLLKALINKHVPPSDGAAIDFFGYSVAISGTTAIVGAWGDDDNGAGSGSAYTFDITTGQQLAKLLPEDGSAGDGFGRSVAISGATAVVGAVYYDDGSDSGSAYLFDTTTGQQLAKLLSDDGEPDDWFGLSVAISGPTAIVGAHRHDDNGSSSGAAFLFDAADASACPWDFDGDGAVGPFDLAFLLGFWGPNPGHPADFDGDGEVGPLDLALVLGNWGPCP
ncbi:MAG: AAA family ATPase [Planctomycetes bacterium]|nr:AAA family ATPase [Planctomycetota bacterium]